MKQLSLLKLFPDCPRTKPIELFPTYHAVILIFFPICPRLKSYCSLQSYQHQLRKTRTQTRRWLLLNVTLSFLRFYKEEETFLTICLQTGATFVWHNEIFKCVGDAQWGGTLDFNWQGWPQDVFGFKSSGSGIFLDGKIWQVFLWMTWLSKGFFGCFLCHVGSLKFGMGFLGGVCCKPYGFWGVLIFALIWSSPSLEIRSTTPPPTPFVRWWLIVHNWHKWLRVLLVLIIFFTTTRVNILVLSVK